MSWKPLDPYSGPPEDEPLTGQALADEVAFHKRTADLHGLPHDPEWDRWLAEDQGILGAAGLAEAKRRFGH